MPDSHVYWIQKQIVVSGEQKAFIVIFECALPTLDALVTELGGGGIVAGNRLHTVADGRGGMLIRGREPYALGSAGTVAIRNYQYPVWEPEDEPAGADR